MYPQRELDLQRLYKQLLVIEEKLDNNELAFSIERDYNVFDLFLDAICEFRLDGLEATLLYLMMAGERYDKNTINMAQNVVSQMIEMHKIVEKKFDSNY